MVFGSIINLVTGAELHWDDATIAQVRKNLSTLSGTKYNRDWKFAGDLDLEECDIVCEQHCFIGEIAVMGLAQFAQFPIGRMFEKAVDAYNRLSKPMQSSIREFLNSNSNRFLTSEKEVIDAYLTWNGTINYTDDIVTLVRSAYGDLK